MLSEDFDFHFHHPCKDTYKECNMLNSKIKASPGSEEITDFKQ